MFSASVDKCSLHPVDKCSVHPVDKCSVHPVDKCSVHPVDKYSVHPVDKCSVHPVDKYSVHPVDKCSVHPVDKCSVHPYWMVYALSFIPLILIKWANSKTKHLSIHVYILIFCCVCREHTPKIALSISKTPCIILSIQQSTRY